MLKVRKQPESPKTLSFVTIFFTQKCRGYVLKVRKKHFRKKNFPPPKGGEGLSNENMKIQNYRFHMYVGPKIYELQN